MNLTRPLPVFFVLLPLLTSCATAGPQDAARPRARDLGIVIGEFAPGPHNAITDVDGVAVGHATKSFGDSVRTGVTVVLPHGGNLFHGKVPAAVCVGNGFGKLAGSTQIAELGELESPIALTNTLSVGGVLDALVAWSLEQPGNQSVRSVNCVVGETNDGWLNDIRGRHVSGEDLREALASAGGGAVAEGSVGAGTGTSCFGWKGGIGTSSRRVGDFVAGVLVQTNFGGRLTIAGRAFDAEATRDERGGEDGSCMIVVATDAPLCARNLGRLCQRALAGMARTGASFANGSGDYVIAFSTAESARIRPGSGTLVGGPVLANDRMTPLFVAVADATEEAILNSMLRATTVRGRDGHVRHALPIERVRALLAAER